MILLPNNSNVILSAEQAAGSRGKPVDVVPTDSIPAGLAAMVAFEPGARAEENAADDARGCSSSIVTGEVTIASRDVEMNGLAVRKGDVARARGRRGRRGRRRTSSEVAAAVVERLLAEPRGVLTLLNGADAPELDGLARSASRSGTPTSSSTCRPAASRTTRSCCPPNRLRRAWPTPIRLVLVEDNQVFREALELLLGLRADIEVVASVADGSSAAEVVREHRPDVVLMDYRLPGIDGVQATRAVREAVPDVAVVCLTASANLREVDALLEAGAVACLTKDQELDEIVAAIRRAAA